MSIERKSWLANSPRSAAVARALPEAVIEPVVELEPDEQQEEEHPSKAFGGMWNRTDRTHTLELRFSTPRGRMRRSITISCRGCNGGKPPEKSYCFMTPWASPSSSVA